MLPELTPLNMHCSHEAHLWALDTCTEAGWQCADCGAVLGYRPDLDRAQAFEKVRSILFWAHESRLVYVSNGTMGEVVAYNVAARCVTEGLFDSYSILRFILEDPNMASHAAYWQGRAAERCSTCGKALWEPLGDCTGHKVDELTQALPV